MLNETPDVTRIANIMLNEMPNNSDAMRIANNLP